MNQTSPLPLDCQGDFHVINYGWERPAKNVNLRTFVREHYRMHYIISGQGYKQTAERTYLLHEGDGFIIFPGELPTFLPDEKNPWDYFWIGISGKAFEEQLALSGVTRKAPLFRRAVSASLFNDSLTSFLISLIDSSRCEYEPGRYLAQILAAIEPLTQNTRSNSDYFEYCLEYIHKNYMLNISISQLAAELNIDRTYLFKLFKNYVGTSPQNYLINHRLSKAERLLISTDDPVSTIAETVGFNDMSYFSKQFKKHHGMTAREFREINRIAHEEN